MTDPLTGLLNRRALQDHVAGVGGPGSCTVLLLDIDHSTSIDDVHGHGEGEEVLRRFWACLAGDTRADDVVVRVGGAEFLLLTSTSADRAAEFAQALATHGVEQMERWSATVSIGVLTVSGRSPARLTGPALQAAIRAADAALGTAENRGRNAVVVRWPDRHVDASPRR